MCLVFVYTNLQRTDKHDIIPKCSPHTHTPIVSLPLLWIRARCTSHISRASSKEDYVV